MTVDTTPVLRIETAEANSAIRAAAARREWFGGRIWIDWHWFGSVCTVFAGHWTHLTQAIVTSDAPAHKEVLSAEASLARLKAVPTFQVPSTGGSEMLLTLGYRLLGTSDVMVRDSAPLAADAGVNCAPGVEQWMASATEGMLGQPAGERSGLEAGAIPCHMADTFRFAIDAEERYAATGALFADGGVGILFADSTVRAHRGKGYQRRLIAARVRMAHELGCHLVTATVEPGSPSARNYGVMGFRRACSRLTFQRPC